MRLFLPRSKVTNQLKEEGIDKKELGREGFLERTWQWKEEYAGTIENQLKKLGISCDWDRERLQAMDEAASRWYFVGFAQ